MRVAVTVEQFWHRVPGGTATATARMLRPLLADADSDVDLIGVAAAHRHRPPPAFRIGLPVRQLPLPRPLLYDAWRLARTPPVQLVTGPVDLVHATTLAIPPKLASGLRRVPLVVTVHDLAFLQAPEHFTARGNRFFLRALELTRRLADAVIVPSGQVRQDCLDAGLPDEVLHVVPHGVYPDRTIPEQVRGALRRHGLHRPYVLWCGTLEPRKNVAGLLAGFAEIAGRRPDLDLVLVGPDGWGDALGGGPRPPADRVKALGFVTDSDLAALYKGAHAFAYPSLREGFGLPVLEAMAHGAPVLTTVGTPMADVAGDAGVIVAPTPQAIAAGLLEVTGPRRDELAARALARAAGYSWPACATATADVYRAALNRPGAGR